MKYSKRDCYGFNFIIYWIILLFFALTRTQIATLSFTYQHVILSRVPLPNIVKRETIKNIAFTFQWTTFSIIPGKFDSERNAARFLLIMGRSTLRRLRAWGVEGRGYCDLKLISILTFLVLFWKEILFIINVFCVFLQNSVIINYKNKILMFKLKWR